MTASVAVFPLSQAFLPGEWVSLRIFEPRYLRMVADLESGSIELCTVLIERGQEVGGGDSRMQHGVMLPVEESVTGLEGTSISCRGGSLITVVEWLDEDPYPTAIVTRQAVEPIGSRHIDSVSDRVIETMKDCRALVESLNVPDETKSLAETVTTTLVRGLQTSTDEKETEELLWRALWLTARMVPCGPLDRHHLLTPGSLDERLDRLEGIISHVRDIVRFRSEP